MTGHGHFIYPNGNRYFSLDKVRFSAADGAFYWGEWIDDKMTGHGKFLYLYASRKNSPVEVGERIKRLHEVHLNDMTP